MKIWKRMLALGMAGIMICSVPAESLLAQEVVTTESIEAIETVLETEDSENTETVLGTEDSENTETVLETEDNENTETVLETEDSENTETTEWEESTENEEVTETEYSESTENVETESTEVLPEEAIECEVTHKNADTNETYVSGDYEYSLNDDGLAVIKKYNGTEKNVVIPSQIDEKSVFSIASEAFKNNTYIESVVISEGIIRILPEVFWGCTNLKSVEIPASVTYIADDAFGGAWWNLYDNTYGQTEFCNSLEQIVIAEGNTVYDSRNNCNAIVETETNTIVRGCKNTVIPNSVVCIGAEAFRNCETLTTITIPTSVTEIKYAAFAGCSDLKKVSLSEGLEKIGTAAFCKSGITSIHIPASVTEIQNYAIHTIYDEHPFSGCDMLQKITVAEGNSVYDSRNDCNAIVETAENRIIVGCINTTIENDIVEIGMYAFSCEGLDIKIPASVEKIYEDSFNPAPKVVRCYSGTGGELYAFIIKNDSNRSWQLEKVIVLDEVHNINYQLDGGKNNSKNPTTFTAESETIVLKNPTRSGWKFDGWYNEYGRKVTKIETGTYEDVTLYAHWIKDSSTTTYKIQYSGNGSTSGRMKAQSATYGKNCTLKENSFKKEGYTFTGWNTKKNGSGTSYKNKQKVKNLTKKAGEKVTLYAQWKKTKYKVTYNLNKGKNSSKNPSTYTITTQTIKLKNPTRKGYTFKGWYSDKKCTKKVTQIKKGSTGKVTLYAKWKKTKYEVTYNLNKGRNSSKNPSTYTITTKTIKLENPTRKGYTFKGWYSDKKCTKKVTQIKKESTGKVTLYAKWKKK